MIQISEDYLEDEIRDGFYIPSIAKRAWAAELSVLHEINRICEKYNIKYYADWGSLLGAVRHGGFVPWDDDLDICMFRSDLNRFLEASEKELESGFRIFSFMNNDYSWKFIFNVVNTERMNFTPEYLKTHYNFPYIATIDIFVIDNVYEDEEKENERREKVKFILSVADALTDNNYKSSKIKELFLDIEKKCSVKINKNVEFIELKRQLYQIAQDIISEYHNDSSEYVVQQVPRGIYNKAKIKRKLYDGIVKLPFESTYILVPKLYDRLLRNKYGEYWKIRMTGVSEHGYPYYNAQKSALGLLDDEDYIPHYKFDDSLVMEHDGKVKIGGLERRCQTIDAIEQFKKSPEYLGEFDRETVIFLPFKGEYWDKMKPFYDEEIAKENVDVYVIPLPYYYKEYNGTLKTEEQYDLELYPEELPIYLVEQIDLEAMFPDRIYIQNPYDEYNMGMSVPRQYYASNIRNLTQKLIYVPWFDTNGFEKENYPSYYNMQYYCTVPGVVLSDEVIVNSQTVKDRYIDKLCDFAGQNTKEIWEDKIIVRQDKDVINSSSKKILLFYTSPSTMLEYSELYIEKLKRTIDVFRENTRLVSVIWYFDDLDMHIIKENDQKLYNDIVTIKKNAETEKVISIVEGSVIYDELIEKCNAYYGDPSHIAKDLFMKNKPVMISNIDV